MPSASFRVIFGFLSPFAAFRFDIIAVFFLLYSQMIIALLSLR